MPRPPKCRRVDFMPEVTFYKPAGVPMRLLEEVCLNIEELEAIRLRDLEDLDQEAAGQRMNVSRATFQRVLESARRKLADALLNGKAIRIEGGRFEMAPRRFRCAGGHEWEVTSQSPAPPVVCPACQTAEIAPVVPAYGRCRHGGRGWGRVETGGHADRAALPGESAIR